MRIIVNADDLGSSRKVNAAVFGLMEKRRISSATLIPNGRAFDDAISRLCEFSHCSFGIHLNVASGPPVGTFSRASPIVGSDGCFRLEAVQRLFLSHCIRDAVLCEWSAQFERLRRTGVRVSHIDSHHHLHTVPALFGALKRVQREFGIDRVRLSRCRRGRWSPAAAVTCLVRIAWNRALRMDGTKATDAFCSLSEFRALTDAIHPRYKTVEIMVHAGTKAAEEDGKLLASEWWSRQLREHQLISYAEL